MCALRISHGHVSCDKVKVVGMSRDLEHRYDYRYELQD
ncbi:thiamin pyrophosphokinase-related protein [Aspergillus luchuensis]|uniref:Thiamin pyrophosphokinase-related protein n=1 Tax=Aspergillus kawachii TaxID=1069201 RepID=A0A146F644_ASPKA|nr:thiamin pyrophosphokinase-related protein [Aspergillus luchuensis]